jgi:3-hydroxy-3-methylglutaryl CoA synthase
MYVLLAPVVFGVGDLYSASMLLCLMVLIKKITQQEDKLRLQRARNFAYICCHLFPSVCCNVELAG